MLRALLPLFLVWGCCLSRAEGVTLRVGPGQVYPTIKAALAQARDHDTLILLPGLYREGNIIIDRPMALIGKGEVILDGERKFEVLSIKADSVLVRGLTIRNSGHGSLEDPGGIKVYDSHHVIIERNVLENNFFGIYLQYCAHSIIRNNRIRSGGEEEQFIGNGIHCWKSDSLLIEGNRIIGHRDGIYFEFVTGSVIWRNISEGNVRYGLHFMFSNSDAYITNLFRRNGAGVAVMFTRDVRMFNNTFQDNWGDAAYGLLLKEISDSYIFNNRFLNNTTGILMEGTSRVQACRNIFRNNGWGMKIQASCMATEVRENNFLANTFDVATNGSLSLNTFDRNYWDKYEGYDLDRDHIGDVPFRPLSLFCVLVERNPSAMLLFRSFMINLLDRSERIIPTLTPAQFTDSAPLMQAIPL